MSYAQKYMDAGRRAAGGERTASIARDLGLNRRTITRAWQRTMHLRATGDDPEAVASPPLAIGAPWIPRDFEKLIAQHVALYRSQKQRVSRQEVQAMPVYNSAALFFSFVYFSNTVATQF